MRIAVHMLTYPREHYGYAFATFALGTLMLQTHRDWTLYVIDEEHGGFDLAASLQALRDDGIPVHSEDRIKVLRFASSVSTGVIPAKRRFAIDQTTEEVIAVFDDDDYRAPEYLATVAAAYASDPAIQCNFRSTQLTYDLSRRVYWPPSVHVGSGSWSLRTQWYRAAGVRIEGKPGQRNASDKIFLEELRRAGEGLARQQHIAAIDLQVLAFWHNSNCIVRSMDHPIDDARFAWLRAKVDGRLHARLDGLIAITERTRRPAPKPVSKVRLRWRRAVKACRRLAKQSLVALELRS